MTIIMGEGSALRLERILWRLLVQPWSWIDWLIVLVGVVGTGSVLCVSRKDNLFVPFGLLLAVAAILLSRHVDAFLGLAVSIVIAAFNVIVAVTVRRRRKTEGARSQNSETQT